MKLFFAITFTAIVTSSYAQQNSATQLPPIKKSDGVISPRQSSGGTQLMSAPIKDGGSATSRVANTASSADKQSNLPPLKTDASGAANKNSVNQSDIEIKKPPILNSQQKTAGVQAKSNAQQSSPNNNASKLPSSSSLKQAEANKQQTSDNSVPAKLQETKK